MGSIFQFIINKIDPVQVFSSSSQSPAVAPYSIPASDSHNSSKALTARHNYAELFDFDSEAQQDWASFALQNYVLAVLSSPLTVVETLAEVQYQKRDDGEEEIEEPSTGAPKLPLLQGGIGENIREVVESPNEGWTALLKGHFTNFTFNVSYTLLQPALEEAINDVFDVFEDTNPYTAVLSHIAVGGLLSPLELVRTRLIVQPSTTNYKKYYGPFHALHNIAYESPSGFLSLYSPRYLIPSIFVHGLAPLLRLASTHVIQEELGLDPTFTPVLYRIATLALMAIEVAVVTPLEMARKRLQAQRIGGSTRSVRRDTRRRKAEEEGQEVVEEKVEEVQTFETCVVTSSKMYSGVLDCIGTIIVEEGGRSKKGRRRKRKPVVGAGGAAGGVGAVPGASGLGGYTPGSGLDSYGGNNEWQKVWGSSDPAAAGVPGLQPYPTYSSAMPVPPELTTPKKTDSGGGMFGAVGRFVGGVRTLYRGFWPRYLSRVVVYAFEEIGRGDDW
ncbi:hypothetical protein HK097_001491 [Rhizophlyctis rosea]|uniref:Mitochondrial carrier n=1 Tax=Rhizophlyctis rosea TaxID=64517 RepID=A0AAD5SLE5_9FUNG|nr:hypothetical protein HK097_001491 [Rhizophlyctis rosea]